MRPPTCVALSSAFLSFFAEPLMLEAAGVRGALLIGAAAVLTPEILRRFASSVLFRPDVTITADPLDPDAKTIAGGLRSAMRLCESGGRAVNVLVSRVPGFMVVIELNAVRQRCLAQIVSAPEATEVGKSQSSLPPFTTGAAPACFRIRGDGDNLRIVLRPPDVRDGRISCSPHVVGAAPAVAAELLLFAVAMCCAGRVTAVAGVLVPAALAFFLMRGRDRRGLEGDEPSGARGTILLLLACCLVVLFNLFRFAVL